MSERQRAAEGLIRETKGRVKAVGRNTEAARQFDAVGRLKAATETQEQAKKDNSGTARMW
ncbi:hypothetical protein WQ73_25400 [Escherichia coli]|nr:hypothetical protein WQ73_25400 [Escherichia coli]